MLSNKDKINKLLMMGTNITGTAVGGALGFLAGDPTTAAGAAIVGTVLNDIANRTLSKKETERVAVVALLAIEKIRSYLDDNKKPRDDDFFENSKKGRADAEEIFEGVLLKSKNEHQEKKLQFLANIFANIAFEKSVTLGEANYIIKLAETLTYRQMCAIALLKSKDELKIVLRNNDYDDPNLIITTELYSFIQELRELETFGIIQQSFGDSYEADYQAILSCYDIVPDNLELTDLGYRIHFIMGLNEIPRDHLIDIKSLLI